MKANVVLNIHQVLGSVGKCVAMQFAEACDGDCVKCKYADDAREAGTAIDDVISILKGMKSKPVKSIPKVTLCRAWGLNMNIAKLVAHEAIKALGIGDRDLVQINVRADIVVGGVVAEITERVGDTVRNYSYVSKKVGWNFR